MHGLAAAVIGLFTSAGGGRGAGPALLFSGMFAAPGRSDWPSGVQEEDVPRFAVEHVQALRPGRDHPTDRVEIDGAGDEAGEIIELFNRPLTVAPRR